VASPDAAGLPPERHPRRIEAVGFYVDEDLLPVGNAMMWTRTDVAVCGARLVADELPLGARDLDWIPLVAAHGWIAVTGNDRIRRNPEESAVAVQRRLRAVCPRDAQGDMTMWQKLTLITRHWDVVMRFADRHPKGPWWLSVTTSGVREVPYSALPHA
jgi:hypothetical protein